MAQPLAPGLLIASPPLADPNFDRTVVLLALHNESGALGFIVNRLAPIRLGELLGLAGYGDQLGESEGPVYVGGPVEPSSGWVLSDDPSLPGGEGVIEVGGRVRVSSSRKAFDAIAERVRGTSPPPAARELVVLGYSGWGPGQLEGEIAQGAWLPAPLVERILFDVEPDQRWEQTYASLGVSPASVMSMRTVGEA